MTMHASTRIADLRRGYNVVTSLLEDHARTRSALRRAYHLTRDEGPGHAIAAVATSMHGFFRYWSPLHEADEEESVVPALLTYARDRETIVLVKQLAADHLSLDRLRDSVARLWQELAESPETIVGIRPELRRGTRQLVKHMGCHLAWEEREILPRVRDTIPMRAQERIIEVMKARRA